MYNREFTPERISELKENEIAPLFANAVDVENIIHLEVCALICKFVHGRQCIWIYSSLIGKLMKF